MAAGATTTDGLIVNNSAFWSSLSRWPATAWTVSRFFLMLGSSRPCATFPALLTHARAVSSNGLNSLRAAANACSFLCFAAV